MKNNITINFNGKDINFFYGLSFLAEFTEEKKLNVFEIADKVSKEPYSFIPDLMYASYLHSCKRNEQEPKIKKLKLFDLIESTGHFKDNSKSAEFLDAFIQSVITTLPNEEGNNEEAKKK